MTRAEKRFASRLGLWLVACVLFSVSFSRADIIAIGDVAPSDDPTAWTWSTDVLVGDDAAGGLTVTGTVNTDVGSMYLGNNSGSSGSILVTGDGTEWTLDAYLRVGGYGDGRLDIVNGTVNANKSANLGEKAGSTGIATVDGSGSSWTLTSLAVGFEGSGELSITNGGTVTCEDMMIADKPGSTGTATVDGLGSTLDAGSSISIGNDTIGGTLNITNGASVSTGQTTIQNGIINFGTNGGTLTTGNLQLTSSSDFAGTGTINAYGLATDRDLLFDATHSTQRTITLNDSPDQNVTINLDVSGTSQTGSLVVGYKNGGGSITIKDGVTVRSGVAGGVGYYGALTSTATVDGPGSTWSAGSFAVGCPVEGAGTGTLHVINGGTIDCNGGTGAVLWGSTATVDGAGSTWTDIDKFNVWGDLNVTNGGTVNCASSFIMSTGSSTTTSTVSGTGSAWNIAGDFDCMLKGYGSLTISDGGLVSVGGTMEINYLQVCLETGGMLALYGQGDEDIDAFLDLTLSNYDQTLHYFDDTHTLRDITEGILGTDYTLNYFALDSGSDFAGYTMLTVGTSSTGGDTAVPEPATLTLLVATLGLGALLRRKRS